MRTLVVQGRGYRAPQACWPGGSRIAHSIRVMHLIRVMHASASIIACISRIRCITRDHMCAACHWPAHPGWSRHPAIRTCGRLADGGHGSGSGSRLRLRFAAPGVRAGARTCWRARGAAPAVPLSHLGLRNPRRTAPSVWAATRHRTGSCPIDDSARTLGRGFRVPDASTRPGLGWRRARWSRWHRPSSAGGSASPRRR